MITIKLVIAIIAFVLSSGQIVFQTFQHHHAINPRRGFIKFMVFIISSVSLLYLGKDIYADFEQEKIATPTPVTSQVEIDYWNAIYRNPTSEGYCDYLEKYPQGQFVNIAKNRLPGDCAQVKREAETEAKKKMEIEAAALKAKIENETKALAEKNAQLEKEAKDNAARIAALEQAKTAAESIPQTELAAEMKIEAELKAKFESDTGKAQETQLPVLESHPNVEVKPKPEAKVEESLF